jgi:glycosyltransferase involved in cell wall biosynthesis
VIKNSIICAYRNRKSCLIAFLRSLFLASEQVNHENIEVVITDLNSTDNSQEIFEQYKDKFNLRILSTNYSGDFWKTKALNHCVKYSNGDFITLLDVDSIANSNLFQSVDSFFLSRKDEVKLCHRVRFITPDISQKIIRLNSNFDKKFIQENLVNRSSLFVVAKERFTEQQKSTSELPINIRNREIIQNALGNSHFTMRKEYYLEIGGNDERFIGRGLEDLDFNLRFFRKFKSGTLKTKPEYSVYHLKHSYVSNWSNEKLIENNRQIYRNNKDQNVIVLPIDENWGEFNV